MAQTPASDSQSLHHLPLIQEFLDTTGSKMDFLKFKDKYGKKLRYPFI